MKRVCGLVGVLLFDAGCGVYDVRSFIAKDHADQEVWAAINLILLFARVAVLLVSWPLAMRLGRGRCAFQMPIAMPPCSGGRPSGDPAADGQSSSSGAVHLLEDVEQERPSEAEQREAQAIAAIEARVARAEDQGKRSFKRNVLLVIIYFMFVGCAICIAAGIVRDPTIQSSNVVRLIAQCCSLAAVFVEFLLFKSAVISCTQEQPVRINALHEHDLYWQKATGFCMCTLCRQVVGEKTGGPFALQCRTCANRYGMGGFAVCIACHRKHEAKVKQDSSLDAFLRSDSGPKPQSHMSVSQFVCRMVKIIWPFVGSVALALGCVGVTQVLSTYIPKVQGDLLNSLMRGASGTDEFHNNLLNLGSLSLANVLFGSVQGVSIQITVAKLGRHMSEVAFASCLRQDIAFYDNVMSGQITSRLTTDLHAITQPMPVLINSIFAGIVTLISGLVVGLTTSWRLTLLGFVFLAPIFYLTTLYTVWASKLQMEVYVHMADAMGVSTQALQNIRTVRVSGGTQHELDKFSLAQEKQVINAVKSAWGGMGNVLSNSLCQQGATFFILYYGGSLVLRGEDGFEAGSIFTFTLLWNTMSGSFKQLLANLNQPLMMMSAGKRVFELVDLQPDIVDDPTGLRVPEDAGVEVACRDLRFAYQTRREAPVLRGLTLLIEAGKTTALVGKSGCGKSTLIRLLLRLYDTQGGQVLVNGIPLKELSLSAHLSIVGYVSQDTQLFRASIRENLTYGLPKGDYSRLPLREEVDRAAELAQASEFIVGLPEGYATVVGEGGHNLSGGQKQRISIARALLRRPRLLLLDEATSSLDAENEALVQGSLNKVMREMRGRCTILLIAHRLATVVNADSIVVVGDGRVTEQGTHTELLRLDGEYKQLVQGQLQAPPAPTPDGGAAAPG